MLPASALHPACPHEDAVSFPPDAISFDEVAAAQRRAIQRELTLNARLDAILARTAALDAKKQSILERILEIGVVQQAPAALPAHTPKQALRVED
jgi:hypothetical protein